MTVLDKENTLLNMLVAQGTVLSQIAQSIATIPGGSADTAQLQASIAALDAHIGKVQSLIGDDSTGDVPAPAPAPAPAPTPDPAPAPAPSPAAA